MNSCPSANKPRSIADQVAEAEEDGVLLNYAFPNDFQFAARMVDRRILGKGNGKWFRLTWATMIASEKNQPMHRHFPITKPLPKRRPG